MKEISYKHFCNLGALNNPYCSSRYDSRTKQMKYYYNGDLSEACWQGYKNKGPRDMESISLETQEIATMIRHNMDIEPELMDEYLEERYNMKEVNEIKAWIRHLDHQDNLTRFKEGL